MSDAELLLPKEILGRATLRENEYAWPIAEIPSVIDAARLSNLVNIGGQLQFRIPNGGTCECHWVQVDTYQDVSYDLPWDERVNATAKSAHAQFQSLCRKYDFPAEIMKEFAQHLEGIDLQESTMSEALCFVWYVEGPKTDFQISE